MPSSISIRAGAVWRAPLVHSIAIRPDCEAGFVEGRGGGGDQRRLVGGRADPTLDWGFRGRGGGGDRWRLAGGRAKPLSSIISGKPDLQTRIHPPAFEPFSPFTAISQLALIERAPRFSITNSLTSNPSNLPLQASNQIQPNPTKSNQIQPIPTNSNQIRPNPTESNHATKLDRALSLKMVPRYPTSAPRSPKNVQFQYTAPPPIPPPPFIIHTS
jgi:hypothetical protein